MKSKLRRFLLKRSILDLNSALESYEVDLAQKKTESIWCLEADKRAESHLRGFPKKGSLRVV